MSNVTTQNSNPSGARFVFIGSEQNLNLSNLSYGGGGLPIRVDDGSIVNLGTSVIQGNGGFTVSDFGGINSAQDSGFVQNLLTTGAISLSSLGNYGYNGTTTQLAGILIPSAINGFLIDNAAGVTMSKNLQVNDYVNIVNGDLNLAENILTLGADAVLTETAGNAITGTTGKITTTRNLNAPSGINIGGLGAALTTTSNLGVTTIERTHAAASGNGNNGILRVFRIAPANNTGLNATLRFYYADSELNGLNEATLTLFKSPTGANNTWNGVGGTVNTTDNYVELSGLDDFSYWTLGDSNNPIPVELISYNAYTNNGSINLLWSTASELNNVGWEIEKKSGLSEDEHWNKIGFVKGIGTTNEIQNYSFNVKNEEIGKYYYRLKQIDLDGSYNYSNQIEVLITGPTEFALYQNYPNPFNPTTTINFEIPKSSFINISVYNTIGEKVVTLANELFEAGRYTRTFDASEFSTGLYIYRLSSDDAVFTKKMLLVK